MIYKCTNGFVVFKFESIQEMEMLYDLLPIPNLVPYTEQPFTFIPETQARSRYMIAGKPVSPFAVPVASNADIIKGFKANRFTYSFFADDIVMHDTIVKKVSLDKNEFGKYWCNFLLQPYSMVGLVGKATDFECQYQANKGLFIFDYIRFQYE